MPNQHNSKLAPSEPKWSSVDKTQLPWQAFVWQAPGFDKEKRSTWKYPHHWVTNGTMYLHRGGLNAAWAAANGARSGKKAAPAVIKHLEAHRKAIKMSFVQDAVCFEGSARDEGSDVIKGVAVLTRGEARGHGIIIGERSLESALACMAGRRIKSRLNHPNTFIDSIDPVESFIGWFHDFRRDGDIIRADFTIAKSAALSPKGNLRDYLLARIEEDPTSLGVSIVCKMSLTEEDEAIFSVVYFADIVGTPAANPNGMFEDPLTEPEQEVDKMDKERLEQADQLAEKYGADVAYRFLKDESLSFEDVVKAEEEKAQTEVKSMNERKQQAEQIEIMFGEEAAYCFLKDESLSFEDIVKTETAKLMAKIEALQKEISKPVQPREEEEGQRKRSIEEAFEEAVKASDDPAQWLEKLAAEFGEETAKQFIGI